MLRKTCKEACILGKSILITIDLPEKVKLIIERLESHGFEAYAVGGCVRDKILKRVPDDWDITTSAKPEEVKALFCVTIDTGIKHGTVTVLIEKEGFEVTTFRLDGDYTDGRHPDNIEFTASITEDLKRRDFTINAMAYSERRGLVDKFGGTEDLKNRLIRAVGIPEERFGEDALRLLRALRFAAQLNFEIEENTYKAVKNLSNTIEKVSAERVAKELEKLILSNNPDKMRLVYESGIMSVWLPELNEYFKNDTDKAEVYLKAMKSASYADKKGLLMIRLSLLLERTGAEAAYKALRRLKLDNETVSAVKKLVDLSEISLEKDEYEMRKTMSLAGKRLMPLFFEVRRAKGLADKSFLYENIIIRGDCTEISELKINGNDLIQLGIPKGKMIGETLTNLLDKVIKEPELNTREGLIAEVKLSEGK